MKSLSLPALALIVASLASSPLAAQELGYRPPSASSHAADPNQFVSTPQLDYRPPSASSHAVDPNQFVSTPQQLGYRPPSASSHAVDPNQFLSTAAAGPLQQRMQQNYALNGYTGPR